MDLANDHSSPTTTSSRMIDSHQKLQMVFESETLGEGETLESVWKRHGVGRTLLYEARRRVLEALEPRRPGPNPQRRELERLRQENEQLRQEKQRLEEKLAEAQDKLSRSVEVTKAKLVTVALILLLCPVSTRQVHDVLVVAFGERFAPADNTLAGWLLQYGRLARKIMAESAAAQLIRSVAADEIYFHGKPILCAVEPRSLTIAALERGGDCTGDTWEIVFDEWPNLELVASDMGKGLLCAVDRTDAHSQVDMLHLGWLFPKVEARLDKRAQEALEWDALYRDHVNDPHCPGRKPHKKLAEAEAKAALTLDDLEAFLRAKELVFEAMSPWTAEHHLATPDSQLRLVERAIELLGTIQAPASGAMTLRNTLEKHKHRIVAFTHHLWDLEVLPSRGSRWCPERVIAVLGHHAGLLAAIKRTRADDEQQQLLALLSRATKLRAAAFRHCRNAAQVEAQLFDRLTYLERSSSLAECINSKLRPLQAIKKYVNQPYLNLFALQHNLKPIERSRKRGGKSPYEILGVRLEGDEKGFVGVLLAAAQREGMLD